MIIIKNRLLICLSIIIVIVWMGIIFSFSNMSSDSSNSGSKNIIRFIVEKFVSEDKVDVTVNKINKPFRKFMHASVYLVLSLFICGAISSIIKNKLYFYNIISLILCFIYALSDEYHQIFVDGRTALFSDVIIDTFGAFIGCLVFNYIYIRG